MKGRSGSELLLTSSPDSGSVGSSARPNRPTAFTVKTCSLQFGNYFLIRDVSCFQEEQLGEWGGATGGPRVETFWVRK